MTAAAITPRKALLTEISSREPRVAPGFNEDGIPGPTSQYFGVNTLGVRQLRRQRTDEPARRGDKEGQHAAGRPHQLPHTSRNAA